MRNFANVSNETLQNKIELLAKQERSTLAEFLEHLVECSERKLFLEQGYNSLFDYLRRGLGFSESCAQKRSQAVGLVKRLPGVLKFVADGVHLSALNTLSAALTEENFESVLNEAKGKTNDELLWLLVSLRPKTEVPKDGVRIIKEKLFPESEEKQTSSRSRPPLQKNSVVPVSESRAHIHFTASKNFADKLARAKDVMRRANPEGNLEELFDKALDLLLEKHAPECKKERAQPSKQKNKSHSRYIPVNTRLAAQRKSNYQCAYLSPYGVCCTSKTFLEFDHRKSFAKGGSSTDPENIQILCSAHNRFKAEKEFGRNW